MEANGPVNVDISLPADYVIGVFPRPALSGALAATHRAGFGPQTRVLDGARDAAGKQLQRMGLEIVAGEEPAADSVLIVVTAPGRASTVMELFQRLGAESVVLARRRGEERRPTASPSLARPDIRIGEDAAAASDA